MKRRKFLIGSASGLSAVAGSGFSRLAFGDGTTDSAPKPLDRTKKTSPGSLRAGVGKSDITRWKTGETTGDMAMKAALGTEGKAEIRIHDPLYAKALVLDDGGTRAAIISMDVIAIGGLGEIKDDFLRIVRAEIERGLNISGKNILVNASHNHLTGGQICDDVVEKTVEAVRHACANMAPVRIGAGRGKEDRITMNRRIKLKNGKTWTERHAIPSPEDEDVAGVGPIDPEIGVLRIDRLDGRAFAVVYNFAAHPYSGASGGGVTAELPGFASKVIEQNLGNGAMALFLQGATGDITEIYYKEVNRPRNAEPLGMMLGLSTLEAWRGIKTAGGSIKVISETLELPRRTDIPERIKALEKEQADLLQSLADTSLNFKAFLPLYLKYQLSPEYPSYYAYWYKHQQLMGQTELALLDAENRRNIEKYLSNIYAMERLARIQVNREILKERQAINEKSGSATLTIEVQIVKVGDFVLVTFPGELSAQIGINIKRASPHRNTFVAAYSNGYIHYAPTDDAFDGWGYEDTNCLLGRGWQQIYEKGVASLLSSFSLDAGGHIHA
jgi:hypothetical protein